MRKLLLVAFVALFTIQTNAQEIKFESEIIDYGKIKKDSDGTRFFTFKNVGDASLIIKSVISDVLTNFSGKPIFPGETGKIKVNFHTGRFGNFYILGNFSQTIIVLSDAKNAREIILSIKGNVIE